MFIQQLLNKFKCHNIQSHLQKMRLKITGQNGFNEVLTLDNDSTLQDLVNKVAIESKIISIRYGYPPVKVELNQENLCQKLDNLNISSGEKISLVLESDGFKGTGSVVSETPAKILKETQIYVEIPGEGEKVLQTHVVPDDNSCLFHSISYCMYKEITLAQELRKIVSDEILKKPDFYNSAILEKSNKEYASWILKKDSWGGGIEISILSEKLEVAIYVVDIDGEDISKFNEDKYDKFIMIVFNGVHYDSVEIESNKKTVFDKNEELNSNIVLSGALSIAKQLKDNGYSFNTHKDRIKCNTCQRILVGERDVAKHAEATGHYDFGQAK
ncbi:hypothetical protein TPHA_0D00210 [Tetrapisispora phaffii CBS 4417]|uniref:Ubiquitin thioesterase OTU n=1 Tax=Tetrapisispora phaffii (strain ATCC 24235 / CBS 4417 / NBRC 1672 / NRRL Y-8282 / UCD 70-5) TaxID=1071381 RepID=G8BS44_TETPH|nr:hypothetical protein TPHA_0D00210 [Tetrapisispora phaffii CBS 4417]CCE62665.1 hypothetical protein TPHA_0D00210 [Tetrapisispora phaffii CBS 4417]